MAISGLGCRVLLLLYLFTDIILAINAQIYVQIENKVTGGHGRDTEERHQNRGVLFNGINDENNFKVGLISDISLPNKTNSWKRLSGQSGSWNEGKRDAGSEDKQEFSRIEKMSEEKIARKREKVMGKRIRRKEDVVKTKSRSSGGGKALSPHDERAASDGEVTKFNGDNHERNKGLKATSTTFELNKEKLCGSCKESNQTEKVDLIGGQREKRDINLADNINQDQIADRVSHPFPQRPPNGITVIHPGRGGIVPVYSPELQQEQFSNQDEMSNENRKQDMFMSFHPIVFQPMFTSSVEMRPHVQRPVIQQHQRQIFNNQNNHEQTMFRFPHQAFRTPHLVNNNNNNNGNVQMINTHRPSIIHEFRPRPQHHTFFSGPHFNRFVNHSHNVAIRPNEGQNNRPSWGFGENRPQGPPNHQLEDFDIRPRPGPDPGSMIFEPPSERPNQNQNFANFQRPRPESNQHRRPIQNEEGGNNNAWNAFMSLIHKNPKRPRFPSNVEGQIENNNFNIFPHTTPSPQLFNPVTGQQLITRLPVQTVARPNSNFEHDMVTNAHSRPITTPRPQTQHQLNIEDFFIPTTDTSVIPFDFPSSFTESHIKNNEQSDEQKFIHHSSIRPNHFRPTVAQNQDNRQFHHTNEDKRNNFRPNDDKKNNFRHIEDNRHNFGPEENRNNFRPEENRNNFRPEENRNNFRPEENRNNFRPEENRNNFRPEENRNNFRPEEDNRNFRPTQHSFRPTERPHLTTPTRPIQKPVPLERPITQRPIPRPTLTRPAHVVTSKPIFTTTPHHTTNDHSQFTHSFKPSTVSNNNFQNEGFTRKPDPAIIPPRPPFLPENHAPMYFIPPLKVNRTSTLNPLDFNLKTAHSTDFPIKNTFTNQQTSVELTTLQDLQHSTASHIPLDHNNNQFIDDDDDDDDFTKPELDDTTWQPSPIDINTQTTSQTPPTTVFQRQQTLRKPSQIDDGMSMNKFLTPFVKFREQESTSQKSFIPNSAVKVTPKAVATPEFSPSLKPASPSHFSVSTTTQNNFRDDSIIGEEFDSLMTPSRPEDHRNTQFIRTSTFRTTSLTPSSTFFQGPTQGIEEEESFDGDDANFNTETENSISWQPTFTTPFQPETNVITTIGPSTQFHPIKGTGLRFPINIQTSTASRPLIPMTTFRPTTFQHPTNVDQFTHLDHERLPEEDINIPLVGSPASPCNADICQLPHCFCGSNTRIPGDLSANEVPQLVLLTFDDDVNEVNWNVYKKILYTGRENPNGCPIQSTFYISHEWTDYSKVNTLYLDGHEIASHSISHPDGASYTKQQWKDEIQGQREILSFMGGVPINQIQGMRAPFLAVGGNKMFGMLYDSNFTYDSSLPVPIHDPPLWPYTLDYSLGHDCMIPPCPRKSFPGVWEIPMVMWVDLKGGRCSMADACSWPDTKEKVFEQLVKNFQRHYKSNRAPFNLFFHSAWFDKPQNMEGFLLFMDRVLTLPDVYFVTSMQAIEWMRQPTSVREIHSFVPFSCHLRSSRGPKCKKPRQCQLKFRGETRYVQSCQESCPAIYPWIKNPFGKQL